MNRLKHYASVSPHTWWHACKAAHSKLKKYFDYEMATNDTLIAIILNPKYRKGIFKQLGVSSSCAKEVIDLFAGECVQLTINEGDNTLGNNGPPSSENLSEPDNFDLLKHLKEPPIEASYDVLQSQGNELASYLQNNHLMAKGKHIIDYWKCQILCSNHPKLGKLVLRYLSIPASSALVECVFSHSGRLKCPTWASLGARTIAHPTCLKEWLNDESPPF
ncbi:hypothetical protein O181_088346 [Austropuccinia psidii MF-1]|uniref:HAT C-terminal dimerisation domain-containing protein n=1 Tax=Austropuccinia psidii MF-1 TaxID=1389203 RepID=A0A9Q3P6V9_9BASI|nr:hypothetical protein [Austropuccinia psidii MF-1]